MSASFTECMHCYSAVLSIVLFFLSSLQLNTSWTLVLPPSVLPACNIEKHIWSSSYFLLTLRAWFNLNLGLSHLLFLLFAFSCFLSFKLPHVLEHLTFSENLNLHWIFLEPAVKTKVGLIKSSSVSDTCLKWVLQGLEILRRFCDGQTGRAALTHILVDRVTPACPPEWNSFCISCHVSLICLLHFFNGQL